MRSSFAALALVAAVALAGCSAPTTAPATGGSKMAPATKMDDKMGGKMDDKMGGKMDDGKMGDKK